jgi:microcystin-dependent protein
VAQPYVGEIRMFAGNFPPAGWAFCQGQTLAISENDILFNLIGTTYGGDGQETFNLPNLASRIPMHQGTGPDGTSYQIGEMAGVEQVTLSIQQIPNHSHPAVATLNTGSTNSPQGSVFATPTGSGIGTPTIYGSDQPYSAMNAQSVSPVGGSQPHENCQPFLALNFIISLYGVFPSQA